MPPRKTPPNPEQPPKRPLNTKVTLQLSPEGRNALDRLARLTRARKAPLVDVLILNAEKWAEQGGRCRETWEELAERISIESWTRGQRQGRPRDD